MSWALLVAVLVAACVGYVVAAVVMTGRGAVAPLAPSAPTPAEADAHQHAAEHRAIAEAEGRAHNTAELTNAQKLDRLNGYIRDPRN